MSVLSPTAPPTASPQTPAAFSELQLEAALRTAAWAPLTRDGWVRVSGDDSVRWLNGMTTNAVAALKPGEGCYTFFLSAQGRIQGDAVAFLQPDALLLETDRARLPGLVTLLDRFIIMDDVELLDRSDARAAIALAGPGSAAALASLGLLPQPAAGLLLERRLWQAEAVELVHAHSPLVPRFELWAEPAVIAMLEQALRAAGVTPASADTFEQLRILEGTPLYGIDIRDRELPQETGQTRALHFSKGCYLGQEIVERIHSRGNVHRTFTGFQLSGELPLPGTPVAAASTPDKPLGELTSVAAIGSTRIALGYLRREALGRGEPLVYPGGSAVAGTLPFQISAASASNR